MLRGSSPIRLQQLDISPAIQAGALEQQAAVNIGQSIQQAALNFAQKQEEKKQEQLGISSIQSLLGIEDQNLAKAIYKDPSVRAAYENQADIQRQIQLAQIEELSEIQKARLEGPQGRIITKAEYDELVAQGQRPKATPQPDGTYLVTELQPFATTPSTVVQIGDGEPSIESKLITDTLDVFRDRRAESVEPVLSGISNLQRLESLLQITGDEGIITGFGADLELRAKSLLKRLGLDFPDVATTQEYLSRTGRQIATVISQFGAGTGISDRDIKFATAIVGGDQTMDKAALKRLIEAMKIGGRDIIERYNQDFKRQFDVEGINETTKSFILRGLIPEEQYKGLLDYEVPQVETVPQANSESTPFQSDTEAEAFFKANPKLNKAGTKFFINVNGVLQQVELTDSVK